MITGKFIGSRDKMTQAGDDHSIEIKPELLVQEILPRILTIFQVNILISLHCCSK